MHAWGLTRHLRLHPPPPPPPPRKPTARLAERVSPQSLFHDHAKGGGGGGGGKKSFNCVEGPFHFPGT